MKSKKSKTIKINCTGSAMMKLADLEVDQSELDNIIHYRGEKCIPDDNPFKVDNSPERK